MKLLLLVLDGVFDLGLAALTDTLATANELAATLPHALAPIEFTFVRRAFNNPDRNRRLAERNEMVHRSLPFPVEQDDLFRKW